MLRTRFELDRAEVVPGDADQDGVLVDSEPISCRVTRAALHELGIWLSPSEVCDRFLSLSTAAMLEEIAAEHRRCRLPEGFAETLRAGILQPFELALAPVAGVRAVLDALPLGRCVASSSHPERMRRSLELAGLPDRFAPRLFSASMVSEGTPAPDLFLLAAARMAAEPARCLVIEDSPAGNRAGKAAGMTAFGFTGGSHLRPETHAPDCGRRAQIPCSPR